MLENPKYKNSGKKLNYAATRRTQKLESRETNSMTRQYNRDQRETDNITHEETETE